MNNRILFLTVLESGVCDRAAVGWGSEEREPLAGCTLLTSAGILIWQKEGVRVTLASWTELEDILFS